MGPGWGVAMTSVLLIDDSTHSSELFAAAMRDELGFDVRALRAPRELDDQFVASNTVDMAVVDLWFPGEQLTGADALLRLHFDQPRTKLVVLTDIDDWSIDLLRDTWQVLPLACALSKRTPVGTQLAALAQVAAVGYAPVDDVLSPLLPQQKSPWRTLDGFSRLVQHRGHAKMWQALLACGPAAEYQDLAAHSGLRLNALRNYRAQLLPELSLHGLHNPPMRDLYHFVVRCRPFLAPFVEAKGLTLSVDESFDESRDISFDDFEL